MKILLLIGLLSTPLWAQPVITIEAKPADALIFVDRRMRGQGTVQLSDLTPGSHLLRISGGEDWETYQQALKVGTQPNKLSIQLKPGGAKWLRLGRQAMLYGDWAEAVHSFKQAAPSQPVAAAWWEGVTQWRAGQNQAALQSFRSYAQFMPQVPQLHWILGQLQEKLKQPGQAFTAYKTAALTLPSLSRALDKLPAPTQQAIDQLRHGKTPTDQLRLAQLLMLKGQMGEACKLARQLLGSQFQEDWLHWEPPIPKPPPILVAPPEDQEP